MTDSQLIDWIEKNAVQIWPNRDAINKRVDNWTVQVPQPFDQYTADTLREALFGAWKRWSDKVCLFDCRVEAK